MRDTICHARAVLLLAVVTGAAACGKGDGGPAPGPGLQTVRLDNVKLSAHAPVGTKVSDTDLGVGNRVEVTLLISMSVKPEGALPKYLGPAIDYYKSMKFENVTGIEVPDGWIITSELTLTDGKGKAYYLQGLRGFDGAYYQCSATTFNAPDRQVLIDICKSLRK